MSTAVDRARDTLAAATLLAKNGHAAQAVTCAFDAARYAAEAALLTIGETRTSDAAVVAGFVQRVVRQRALNPEAGRLLRLLHNRALLADLTFEPVPPDEAVVAVRDATTVVDAVEAWLDEPVRTAQGPVQRRAVPVEPAAPAKPARRRR
ncbi:MAG: HEPN domain-containing protein [Pseudonocardia sp.]